MKKRIIAISGKATSGKTTLSQIICYSNPAATRVPFAEELKMKAIEDFGVTPQQLITGKNDIIHGLNKDMTIRQLLIEIGRMYRAVDKNFWVKRALRKIELDCTHDTFIIDDLRFKNEARILRENGAKLIRINRPGISEIDDESEKDLDNYTGWDMIILNNGSKEYLKEMSSKVLEIPCNNIPNKK